MTLDTVNVVFAGIGGQGVILASDLLTAAAFRSGFDVKKSELHGMSQRGGSVSSDVRFGTKVWSPMIPEGQADFLVSLAEDQVEVCRHLLKPGGIVLSPSMLGDYDPGRSMNIAMLGALNAHLKLPDEIWNQLLAETFSGELLPVNQEAFRKGAEFVK
ncbi:MAG: 2-oxoacid:acceptor oxidoreductase family protein [Victivallales bacterium]|nr:2-oxoacid:acceptor oxidoreductase family protein [bacterium]MDY5695448.1 2-oxoacid:acceptor oxidoreductase family protein [Victivallales bacterium]